MRLPTFIRERTRRPAGLAALLVLSLGPVGGRAGPSTLARVAPNDNRTPAGRLHGDTLELRLVAQVADWHPDGDAAPGAPTETFAEEGGAPSVPGPLVRVRAATVVAVSVRNALDDTLRLRGLHARLAGAVGDTTPLVLAPGERREVRFRLDAPGTYLYWASTTGRALSFRTGRDAQLSGAIVVDPRDGTSRPDRVL